VDRALAQTLVDAFKAKGSEHGSLDGEVAVVTGGGHGIGAATAIRLAQDGARVAIWDTDIEAAQRTRGLLESTDGKHIAIEVDVSDSDAVASATSRTVEELGTVGVLINNAGVVKPRKLWETTDEDWQTILAVNLGGQFRCSRALVPGMITRRSGSIVNISSISALNGRRQAGAAYTASKGGVIALTYALAAEAAEYNIRVNCICPGTVLTGVHTNFAKSDLESLLSTVLLRRDEHRLNAGRPEDVAELAWFLASPASSWITGTVIPVSGGQVFR
jgi:3-oxoacyl-[acyl-carrier protein] reductase